jgi:hypothetical protein
MAVLQRTREIESRRSALPKAILRIILAEALLMGVGEPSWDPDELRRVLADQILVPARSDDHREIWWPVVNSASSG